MLGFLIVLILSFSLITAILQGSLDAVCSALLASPQKAVELAVATGCGICLWSGVMEVARQAGLLKALSNLFSPIVSRLFPRIKKDSAAAQAVCVNLAANLLGLGAAAAGGAAVLLTHPGLLKGYQFRRILAVLTPEDPDLADIAYQQNKAAMAIGTGGLTGQGLFQQESIFIPNAWNDFIFSYLANALGFVGALAVLGLLGALLLRTLRTAAASVDLLGRLIATGVFGALFLQCVINIGMNLQVLPVIGVTLPFFSAGGSSVLMVYLSVGLVLSIGLNSRRSAGLAAPIE